MLLNVRAVPDAPLPRNWNGTKSAASPANSASRTRRLGANDVLVYSVGGFGRASWVTGIASTGTKPGVSWYWPDRNTAPRGTAVPPPGAAMPTVRDGTIGRNAKVAVSF